MCILALPSLVIARKIFDCAIFIFPLFLLVEVSLSKGTRAVQASAFEKAEQNNRVGLR